MLISEGAAVLCCVEKESLYMLAVLILNGAKRAVTLFETEFLYLAPWGEESRSVSAPNGGADFFAFDVGCHVDYFY